MTFDPILTASSAPLAKGAGPHVLVVGGGASGVLMAAHLLRDPQGQAQVTILEGRHMLGCGIAYSTQDPGHLLNTRVSNMSAFARDPDHFRRWLAARPGYVLERNVPASSGTAATVYWCCTAPTPCPTARLP